MKRFTDIPNSSPKVGANSPILFIIKLLIILALIFCQTLLKSLKLYVHKTFYSINWFKKEYP